jgi:hypothetical protein
MKNLIFTKFCVAAAVVTLFSAGLYADPQPHMKAALESLQKAKEQLEKASSDKGGHRMKAIGLVKDAIEETKKGIAFDNKN